MGREAGIKRTVVAVPIVLILLGASSSALPQRGERTSATPPDLLPQVVYAIDPVTGEHLFADDIDPLFFDASAPSPVTFAAVRESVNDSTSLPLETSGLPAIMFDMIQI